MLLAMVIICGFFMVINLIAVGYKAAAAPHDASIIGNIAQGLAWAFLFIVNLIALVK